MHRNPHTGVAWWTSADSITYAHHPTPVLINPDAFTTHRPDTTRHDPDDGEDDEPPPF